MTGKLLDGGGSGLRLIGQELCETDGATRARLYGGAGGAALLEVATVERGGLLAALSDGLQRSALRITRCEVHQRGRSVLYRFFVMEKHGGQPGEARWTDLRQTILDAVLGCPQGLMCFGSLPNSSLFETAEETSSLGRASVRPEA